MIHSLEALIVSGPTGEEESESSRFAVDAASGGMRIDQFLGLRLAGRLSRSRVQALIEAGEVTVNGARSLASKRKVLEGDVIEISVPEPADADPIPEPIPLTVLFEDAALIVIDKPAGLVVHPGPGNWSGTLVNALLHHCGDSLSGIGGVKRPGIVHRLDKDTSGVMVVAKTDRAHRDLAGQFAAHGRDGRMERAYLAVVWGVPSHPTGTVDAALGRSGSDRTKRTVVPSDRADARDAVTRFSVIGRSDLGAEPIASLVECVLETGRTHQIRVHMAHIGHPLVGDDTYGGGFKTKVNKLPEAAAAAVQGFSRQALHAFRLAFQHPETKEAMRFETEPPRDMHDLTAALGMRRAR